MSCCKLCNNLKILKCFDCDGDGFFHVYLKEPEKGNQPVRCHIEEAYEGSIFLGCASVTLSAGWHVASRGNLSPLTQTHKRLYFMAVCVGIEPTERCSRSRFSKPAHLPLCQHTSWQELKDSNPYKMIWNHLC